jgi:hypothetical protein
MDGTGWVQSRQRYSKLTTVRLVIWGVLVTTCCLICVFATLEALTFGLGGLQFFGFLFGVLWITFSVSRIQKIRVKD